MTDATDRLNASISRLAGDVTDAVSMIRDAHASGATDAVNAACDKLDALSGELEGLKGPPASEQPQG